MKSKKKPLRSKSKSTELDKLGKLAANDQIAISLTFISQFVIVFGEQATKLANQTKEASIKEGYEFELGILKIRSEIQYVLSNYATRTLTEINIFSQLFSDMLIGFRTKHQFVRPHATNEMLDNLNYEISQLRELEVSFNSAIEGVSSMKESIINFKNSNLLKENQNLQMAILASEQIINEIRISQNLIDEMLESLI